MGSQNQNKPTQSSNQTSTQKKNEPAKSSTGSSNVSQQRPSGQREQKGAQSNQFQDSVDTANRGDYR